MDLVSGGLRAEDLFSMRNTFIGVSGNFGKFFFGTYDTPMKRSQGKADLFNDQAGGIKNILNADVRAKESFFSVTHNMQQAARVSDYTAFLENGVLVEYGETDQVFTRPREPRTEKYVIGRFG